MSKIKGVALIAALLIFGVIIVYYFTTLKSGVDKKENTVATGLFKNPTSPPWVAGPIGPPPGGEE